MLPRPTELTPRSPASTARVQSRERSTNDLKQRHDALRARVGEAIAALDALGARNG